MWPMTLALPPVLILHLNRLSKALPDWLEQYGTIRCGLLFYYVQVAGAEAIRGLKISTKPFSCRMLEALALEAVGSFRAEPSFPEAESYGPGSSI